MNPQSQLALDKMKHLLGMAQQESQFLVKVSLPWARGIAVTLLESGMTKEDAIVQLASSVDDAQMHMASLEELKEDMTLQLTIAIDSAKSDGEHQKAAFLGSGLLLEMLLALKEAFQAAESISQFLNKASGPAEER